MNDVGDDKELFQKGLKDGIAIGVSYIPAAMAISIAASKQNFPFGIWELMSALLYTTSGQAAVLNLLSNRILKYCVKISGVMKKANCPISSLVQPSRRSISLASPLRYAS